MRTWTNLPWPDDPYRTGQQLYRRPAGRLAAFTTWPTVAGGRAVPLTTAIVYLPLDRSRPVSVTGQTLAFGFRAVSADDVAAHLLNVPVHTPLLSVERVSYTYGDKPVEVRRGLYVTDHHHYRNELS